MSRYATTEGERQATFERLVETVKARGMSPAWLAERFRTAYGYWPKGYEPIATNAKGGEA